MQITNYYKTHKTSLLFVVSILLTLIGWIITVVSYKLLNMSHSHSHITLESAPLSLVIRLIYGLLSTIMTNYYLDQEYTKKYTLWSFLTRYQYYIIFSTVTIVSGWFISIQVLLTLGYTISVCARLLYGILCTFITLRFIPVI